jgi:hypothetical protein
VPAGQRGPGARLRRPVPVRRGAGGAGVEFGRTEDTTTTTQAAAFHLIDLLRELPEAYVLMMAYRNFASGPDRSIEHLRREFEYASGSGAACGIVIGQEFTEAYGHLPQFRGISVDDMDAYQEVGEYRGAGSGSGADRGGLGVVGQGRRLRVRGSSRRRAMPPGPPPAPGPGSLV